MRIPKYRKFSPRNIGFVEWNGSRHYFTGHPFNSPESRKLYFEFLKTICSEKVDSKSVTIPTATIQTSGLTFADLADRFLEHAESYFRGARSELPNYRRMLVVAVERYGHFSLRDFGPVRLTEFQNWLAATDHVRESRNKKGEVTSRRTYRLTRSSVNHILADLKRVFKWGVSQEIVSADQLVALQTVSGLRAGRSHAKENKPREPVTWEHVEPVLQHLSTAVAAMVRIQWSTGCRSHSVCMMKPCEIDRTQSPWLWKPTSHKGSWRGHELSIFLGPKAQEILLPYLQRDENQFCFSPREVTGRQSNSDHYNSGTYGKAVLFGLAKLSPQPINQPFSRKKFEDAGLVYWSPHQLRHAKAHLIREEFGLEAAQAVLGHASLSATQIYAKKRDQLARSVADKCG
jgi:integrase